MSVPVGSRRSGTLGIRAGSVLAVTIVSNCVLGLSMQAPAVGAAAEARAVITVTSTADSGPGSLRQAIFDAGATFEDDVIRFAIPGDGVHTIRPETPLPLILDTMTIDGTTQPGYAGTPRIEIDCSMTTSSSGLILDTTGAIVRGLAIHGADGAGILVVEGGGNRIEACHIGTDATGLVARPNVYEGIAIVGSAGNVIGGSTAAARNVISGNGESGITITTQSSGTRVFGNFIGTDATGAAVLPNLQNGIYIEDSSATEVGGPSDGEGNVIGGNAALGIGVFGGSTATRIQGNAIGESAFGLPAGNGYDGVYIEQSTDTRIGGDGGGEGNRIANNGASGVRVYSGERNTISRNSIDENDWLAIDIGDDGGVTPNDDDDLDAGANGLLNHPDLSSVESLPGATLVRGHYDGAPEAPFRLEFFSNEACDPFDNGEAAIFRHAVDVATGVDGTVEFEVTLPVSVPAGTVVAATATDDDGNTSDLSECALVRLSWNAPTANGGPPSGLTVSTSAPTPEPSGDVASPSGVAGYSIYHASASPVPVTAANRIAMVPASRTSMNVPARTGGFFVVTARYADGSESAASNEAGTPGSPTIASVRLQGTSKLVFEGVNFTSSVTVIIDGIPFAGPPKVKRQGTRVVQKGVLVNGMTIGAYLASRPSRPDGGRESLCGVRNSSGAVATLVYRPNPPRR